LAEITNEKGLRWLGEFERLKALNGLISGLETNGPTSQRLVEIPFWRVSRALSLAILANENFKALKHRMETKQSINSDDWIPKANRVSRILKLILWKDIIMFV